jgi:hypothetical protein
MKSQQTNIAEHASLNDARIDAALGIYARAVPSKGLESRISARLSATQSISTRPATAFRLIVFRRVVAGALATAAAGAIVVGTVRHSHSPVLPPVARAPQASGVSAANSQHIPTHAITQAASPHGQATAGRARNSSAPKDKNAVPTNQPSTDAPQR